MSVERAISLLLARQRAEFLASPDTFFGRSVDTYATGLERDTASWSDLRAVDFEHLIETLNAFNLAALLCHRVGRSDVAIRLERRAMDVAWRSSEDPRWRLHIAQPALNIARVYRGVGARRRALAIFEALHRVAVEGGAAAVCGLRINRAMARDLREAEPEATRVIWLCRAVENLKCAVLIEDIAHARSLVDVFGSTRETKALAFECHLKLDVRARNSNALFARIGRVCPDEEWAFVYALDALLDKGAVSDVRAISRGVTSLLARRREPERASQLLCAVALRQIAAGDVDAIATAAAAEEAARAADSEAGRLRALTVRTIAAKRFGLSSGELADRLWCGVLASRHAAERLFACAAAATAIEGEGCFLSAGATIARALRPLAQSCREAARIFRRAIPHCTVPMSSTVLDVVVARLMSLSRQRPSVASLPRPT